MPPCLKQSKYYTQDHFHYFKVDYYSQQQRKAELTLHQQKADVCTNSANYSINSSGRGEQVNILKQMPLERLYGCWWCYHFKIEQSQSKIQEKQTTTKKSFSNLNLISWPYQVLGGYYYSGYLDKRSVYFNSIQKAVQYLGRI